MTGASSPRGASRASASSAVSGLRHDSRVATLKAVNLGLKFLLELAAIAAFAYWGATIGGGLLAATVAVVAPVIAIVLWGIFAAPQSTRRLPTSTRAPFELAVFGLAVVALLAAGSTGTAVVLGVVVLVNAGLMTVFGQWSE